MQIAPLMRRILIRYAVAAAGLYLLVLALLFVRQRDILYQPAGGVVAPAQAGLGQARVLNLVTADRQTLLAWYVPARPGRPVILYFHGNGDSLGNAAGRISQLTPTGDGVLAVEYRGYPGSSGKPSEAGLIADGEAGYREARALGFDDKRIVLLGESLGSGVAVALAARHPVGALALDSPYSSLADVAAYRYPIFPVRWLVLDSFRSDRRISQVRAPVLIVHGDADPVIPIRFARRLFALAHEPKTMIVLPGVGHLAMAADMPAALAWMDKAVGAAQP
jgi:fermentation-respiration switch protein FrsA (DUF1100 family)